MATMGSQCEVYMQMEGLVDANREIVKLEEAIAKKTALRDKIIEATEVEGYEEKVSELTIHNDCGHIHCTGLICNVYDSLNYVISIGKSFYC